ncbi:hypothetical protein SNEBB_008102 [Seison nebaliae]|nr:hypothetical protein SNEBB_008102 [Seison nebaliae]
MSNNNSIDLFALYPNYNVNWHHPSSNQSNSLRITHTLTNHQFTSTNHQLKNEQKYFQNKNNNNKSNKSNENEMKKDRGEKKGKNRRLLFFSFSPRNRRKNGEKKETKRSFPLNPSPPEIFVYEPDLSEKLTHESIRNDQNDFIVLPSHQECIDPFRVWRKRYRKNGKSNEENQN